MEMLASQLKRQLKNSNRWHAHALAEGADRSLQTVTKESSRCEKTLVIPPGADASSCSVVFPGVVFGDPRFMTTGDTSIAVPDKFDQINNLSISLTTAAEGVVVPGWDDQHSSFADDCKAVEESMKALHMVAAKDWMLAKVKAINKLSGEKKKAKLSATNGIQPAKMKQLMATAAGNINPEAALVELHLQGKGCSEDFKIVNMKKTLYDWQDMGASEFKSRCLNIVPPKGVPADFPYRNDVLMRGDAVLVQCRLVCIAACNNFHCKLEPTEVIVLSRQQGQGGFSLAALAGPDFSALDDEEQEDETKAV